MKKILYLILLFYVGSGCSTIKNNIANNEILNNSLKNEINTSIIDGFYNNDTINVGNSIYLLR